MQEGKRRKNGGQGHSQDFFQGSRGGGHTVSTESTHHFFFYLNIVGCLFKKRLKKGV